MSDWRKVVVSPEQPIIDTMKQIDETTMQFAAVVDEEGVLVGTVTDGDIRRGILKGIALDEPISSVMNKTPVCGEEGRSTSYYKKLLLENKLKQLPIISSERKLIRVVFLTSLENDRHKPNRVILMVGGLGTRLRPLTEHIPKPMLHIGNKPILETIIESFKSYGFVNFILSVNYKKDIIMNYFQDGSHLDVHIEYIEEEKRLGTAGALSLLKEKPNEPFFVMNGDLLTKVNYEQLLNFHVEHESMATMCVREYEFQVPYGVIETEGHLLSSIVEKPVHKSFVNAGIYILNPHVLDYIPTNEFYDMPELFNKLMHEKKAAVFPLTEYWLDIGKMADFEKAKLDYQEAFDD